MGICNNCGEGAVGEKSMTGLCKRCLRREEHRRRRKRKQKAREEREMKARRGQATGGDALWKVGSPVAADMRARADAFLDACKAQAKMERPK